MKRQNNLEDRKLTRLWLCSDINPIIHFHLMIKQNYYHSGSLRYLCTSLLVVRNKVYLLLNLHTLPNLRKLCCRFMRKRNDLGSSLNGYRVILAPGSTGVNRCRGNFYLKLQNTLFSWSDYSKWMVQNTDPHLRLSAT